ERCSPQRGAPHLLDHRPPAVGLRFVAVKERFHFRSAHALQGHLHAASLAERQPADLSCLGGRPLVRRVPAGRHAIWLTQAESRRKNRCAADCPSRTAVRRPGGAKVAPRAFCTSAPGSIPICSRIEAQRYLASSQTANCCKCEAPLRFAHPNLWLG